MSNHARRRQIAAYWLYDDTFAHPFARLIRLLKAQGKL
jgi:hypothetical protein